MVSAQGSAPWGVGFPHTGNAHGLQYNSLVFDFNRVGVDVPLRMSLPYPTFAAAQRSTIGLRRSSKPRAHARAARQEAVIDLRCCLDWPSRKHRNRGQRHSLGASVTRFFAPPRVTHKVAAFNSRSTTFFRRRLDRAIPRSHIWKACGGPSPATKNDEPAAARQSPPPSYFDKYATLSAQEHDHFCHLTISRLPEVSKNIHHRLRSATSLQDVELPAATHRAKRSSDYIDGVHW